MFIKRNRFLTLDLFSIFTMDSKKIKNIVKKKYSGIANSSCGCCSSHDPDVSKTFGYSDNEVNNVPEANLGLGCGNPTALIEIKKGDIVLDLGSGAGFDAFLAAKEVGETGKVIGVDMTIEMVNKAIKNAEKYGYKNTEFKLGDIEDLPVIDKSVAIIISNCVINLAPNKEKVFSEAFRVLKTNGKLCVSDIVLLENLSEEQKKDEDLIAGCVGGAILKEEYLEIVKKTGFFIEKINEDKDISKRQYDGIALESLKIIAIKK